MLGVFLLPAFTRLDMNIGSFESVRWNACVHRLDLGLYSHPKEFWGNEVRTHVNPKGKTPLPEHPPPREGSNHRRCIKQDRFRLPALYHEMNSDYLS